MKPNPGIMKMGSTKEWDFFGTFNGKKHAEDVGQIMKKKYGIKEFKIDTKGKTHHELLIDWG